MSRFEKIYKDVPLVQKEWLKNFREMHHYHHQNVGDINWKYIKCGRGKEVVVMLPGSVRSAEVWAKLISYLEPGYRIISPTYPAIESMGPYGLDIHWTQARQGAKTEVPSRDALGKEPGLGKGQRNIPDFHPLKESALYSFVIEIDVVDGRELPRFVVVHFHVDPFRHRP